MTRIEISRTAISKNISSFRNLIGTNRKFAAIVKSNAYGHGVPEVARISIDAGADVLGVNSIQEAMELEKIFPGKTILIMGEIQNIESYREELSRENFWVVASRLETLEFLSRLQPRPKIHLKTDTGMGRLGHSEEVLITLMDTCKKKNIPLNGIMTHFASTEDFTEHSYSMKQLSKFQSYISYAESIGYTGLIRHAAASASAMLFEEARLDMVRVGISLYGLWPSIQTRLSLTLMGKDFELHPALTWKTKVVHIQDLPAGSYIGYGSTYKTNYPTKVAVIPVGYNEGFDRRLSNQGHSLISGEIARVIGRVCMNMSMLDVTHISGIKVGEEVVLIGQSGKETYSADDHANLTGTINYDVVTRLNRELERVVVE